MHLAALLLNQVQCHMITTDGKSVLLIAMLLPPLPLLPGLQIEGDHSMDAVFSTICKALDEAKAKIGDPLEDYCAQNPEQPECLVYDD